MCGTVPMKFGKGALLFARRNDLFALVVAAVRADAVRLLGAAAMAAGIEARALQLPVGAALLAAGARVSPLGYGHGFLPSSRSGRRTGPSARSTVRTGLFVSIRAAHRAQPLAVLPAMGGHRQLDQQRLTGGLAQLELPAVVKLHVLVALERLLVDPPAGSGPLGVQVERRTHGKLEGLEASHAFERRHGSQHTLHADLIAALLDVEVP